MKDFIGQELQIGDIVTYPQWGGRQYKHLNVGFIKSICPKTLGVFPHYNVGKKYRKGRKGEYRRFTKYFYPEEVIKISYDQIPNIILERFTEKQLLLFLNTIRTKDVTKLVQYARSEKR